MSKPTYEPGFAFTVYLEGREEALDIVADRIDMGEDGIVGFYEGTDRYPVSMVRNFDAIVRRRIKKEIAPST